MSKSTLRQKVSGIGQKKPRAGKHEKYNVNITSSQNSNNKDNSTVIYNDNSKIHYFLPALNKKLIKMQEQKSHKNYLESFMLYSQEMGVFLAHFLLQTKPTSVQYQPSLQGM